MNYNAKPAEKEETRPLKEILKGTSPLSPFGYMMDGRLQLQVGIKVIPEASLVAVGLGQAFLDPRNRGCHVADET